jgi:predicted amidohydrolase
MKVAAIQLNSQDNKKENITKAIKYIAEAANKGTDFVVLPEYVDFMGEDNEKLENAETIPGPTSNAFAKIAKEHGIYLLGGSIHEKEINNSIYNTSLLFNRDGKMIAKYRKVHLYDAQFKERHTVNESEIILPGDEIITAETSFGTVGLSICYDVRFPEMFRSLALMGSQVIFAPAAFPMYTGSLYWEVLLRARAVENQCFIVASGQFGTAPPDQVLYGNSMIIDPWGTVLARAPEKESIIIADIDLSYIEKVRNNIPCFNHRRPDVYSGLLTNEE